MPREWWWRCQECKRCGKKERVSIENAFLILWKGSRVMMMLKVVDGWRKRCGFLPPGSADPDDHDINHDVDDEDGSTETEREQCSFPPPADPASPATLIASLYKHKHQEKHKHKERHKYKDKYRLTNTQIQILWIFPPLIASDESGDHILLQYDRKAVCFMEWHTRATAALDFDAWL